MKGWVRLAGLLLLQLASNVRAVEMALVSCSLSALVLTETSSNPN